MLIIVRMRVYQLQARLWDRVGVTFDYNSIHGNAPDTKSVVNKISTVLYSDYLI